MFEKNAPFYVKIYQCHPKSIVTIEDASDSAKIELKTFYKRESSNNQSWCKKAQNAFIKNQRKLC